MQTEREILEYESDKWREIENAQLIKCPAFKKCRKCKMPVTTNILQLGTNVHRCGQIPCDIKVVLWNTHWEKMMK